MRRNRDQNVLDRREGREPYNDLHIFDILSNAKTVFKPQKNGLKIFGNDEKLPVMMSLILYVFSREF